MSRARRRDRRVYLASHPVLFTLLAATRRVPVLRLGRTVVVHSTDAFRDALTRLPLDRLAAGTTGGAARELVPDGLLFDQEGADHRGTRRSVGDGLSAAGVERLRPVWTEVLDRRLAPLGHGDTVDIVDVASELAGATACALLGLDADPRLVARAARDAAAAAARDHVPGVRRPGAARRAAAAAQRLTTLLGTAPDEAGLAAMLTVAAVNTTVAGLPRAVAWCADGGLWTYAADECHRGALVDELLRVVAPTPLLPRVAAATGTLAGRPVGTGDRLILVSRHATGAHRDDPDCLQPAPPQVAQLVFGAGPHACPGARLARAHLSDTLRALAPLRPVVVRARGDRAAALPGWASLVIAAGGPR
jgi:cytochrome P450